MDKRHIQDHSAGDNTQPHWGYPDRIVPCKNDAGSCAYLDIVYASHDNGMLYMGILWATLAGILFSWWFWHLSRPSNKSIQRISNTIASSTRKWLLPDANHFIFGRTTRLQVAILGILCAYLTLWTFLGIVYGTWITPIKNNPGVFNTRTSLGPWSNRIGVVAYALTPLSVLLSSRESLLSVMTGVPYQNFNFLHRWTGYVILFQSIMHTIGWCIIQLRLYQPQPTAALTWIVQTYIIWGIVAMILLILMFALSTPWGIRATGYEFFRKAHYVLAMVYIGACWAHWSRLECFLIPAFIIWGIDRGARLFRTFMLHYHPDSSISKTGFTPADAQITVFPDAEHGDIVRLDLKNSQDPWKVGQHFYLCFTECSIWQSHPFTPLNAPILQNGTITHSYILRAKGGETKKLAQLAIQKVNQQPPLATSTPVILTGPYGEDLFSKIDTDTNTNIVCVAGGTGISYVLPLLLQLCRQNPVADRKIELIWAVRHASNVEWISDEMNVLRKHQDALNLNIRLCVTREDNPILHKTKEQEAACVAASSSSEDIICPCEKTVDITENSVSQGRPNLSEIVSEFVQNTISGRTVVFASGPGGMITDLRRAVATLSEPAKVWKGEERFNVNLVHDDRLEW